MPKKKKAAPKDTWTRPPQLPQQTPEFLDAASWVEAPPSTLPYTNNQEHLQDKAP